MLSRRPIVCLLIAWQATAMFVLAAEEKDEDSPEVHVVSLHSGRNPAAPGEPGVAAVRVERPGKKVVLVLAGSSPISWTVDVGPKTEITKLILAGATQTVYKLPEGTELIDATRARPPIKRATLELPSDRNDVRLRRSIAALHKFTGLEISSLVTDSSPPASGILVNQVQHDDQLHSDYPQPEPPTDLPEITFSALHIFRTPAGQIVRRYADFTLQGPRDRDAQEAPATILQIAHDSDKGDFYGLGAQSAFKVDLKDRSVLALEPNSPDIPKASWPRGITFDPKRKRLLISDDKHLFAYDPATEKWSVLASVESYGIAAIAWSPEADRLYAVSTEFGDGTHRTLEIMNSHGALIKRMPLSGHIPADALEGGRTGSLTQLVVVGKHLVLITAPQFRSDPDPVESFVYLVDPRTGKARLTARY